MKKIVVLVVLSLVLFVNAQTQSDQEQTDSDELANIGKSLKETISKEMPGWTHRSIEPIQGSQLVIIQQWELGDIVVKIAITKYRKLEQAETAFKESKSQLRTEEDAAKNRGRGLRLIKEELLTLGDEGYI